MTSPYLVADLKRDEGLRLKAYPDPISGGAPWTVGYGATGPDIGPDTVWTEQEADEDLSARVFEIIKLLDEKTPWWRSMCDYRQDVLANLCYNLGWPRLNKFVHALEAMRAHNYDLASLSLLNSEAARELPLRYERLAEQMKTGERVASA